MIPDGHDEADPGTEVNVEDEHAAIDVRLARALLAKTLDVLPWLPLAARDAPLAAMDAFVATPSAGSYVAAVSALHTAWHAHVQTTWLAGSALRSREAGLAALMRTGSIDPALVDRLRHELPHDARSGQRLSALAALLEAHDEIAGRVLEDAARWRRRFVLRTPTRPRKPRPARQERRK